MIPATDTLLRSAVAAAVPLWIVELAKRHDLGTYMGQRGPEIASLLAEKGDLLLFRGKKKGESAAVFSALAEGIALGSFCPGGIAVFGDHYDAAKFVPHVTTIIRHSALDALPGNPTQREEVHHIEITDAEDRPGYWATYHYWHWKEDSKHPDPNAIEDADIDSTDVPLNTESRIPWWVAFVARMQSPYRVAPTASITFNGETIA